MVSKDYLLGQIQIDRCVVREPVGHDQLLGECLIMVNYVEMHYFTTKLTVTLLLLIATL